MAIENIYDPELGEFYLVLNFGRSAVFSDARSAQEEAAKLHSEWSVSLPVEYGIVLLKQFTNLEFPQITIAEAEEKIRTAFLLTPKSSNCHLKGDTMAKTVTTFMKLSRVPIVGEMISLTKEDSAKVDGAKYVRVTSIIHTDRAEGQSAIVKAVTVWE
jgi:hypothetical protein